MKAEINFTKDNGSLNRPAWTSSDSTGQMEAYKHKHSIVKGKFLLDKNYYERHKGINV
ncbi:MAG: hypothetical protein ACW972_03565 [Promethearchaeota archaeon]|jgi:hypothetical protein